MTKMQLGLAILYKMYLNGADLNDVVKWPEITQSDETAIYKITWWLKTLLTMYEDQTNL